jgi:hypothetical protein
MLGRDDHGFVDIKAMALNAAIRGSIFADPEAGFAIIMACLGLHQSPPVLL